ncbi:ferrous iron transport protein B [Clostridium brassicae]|uniref:Ferrous iron transport protein B n=1 Tax=Clostridium brassicae TaxID=2999072 RepID=A0ABT4DAG6_9CLOT|nr:ferrous iron transport protein B [Clostridium brassicae]MCY6959306.1 ferrous iron transport protein B [Clostridium brassicae]
MLTAALVGNPNVGKTTLFNYLTGSNQYVGNWAGVTVEKKEGYTPEKIKIVDLPGIYAMDTFSNEEKVAKDFLLQEETDVIINIVDASNLDRNLYLTTQLKQFKKPIILVLNMIDVAEAKGMKINFHKLSKELGVTVIPIIASKGKGLDEIKTVILQETFSNDFVNLALNFKNEKETYTYIENMLNKCVFYSEQKGISITEKIDKILLNKLAAYPIFLGILFLIFQFTFSWVGQPLADFLEYLLNNNFIPYVESSMSGSSAWFQSMMIEGIIGGVGSVIVFLPVILTLFLGISFLEDSGYMARAAFIMDKLMRKMGLSGKAFIPLIVGFGCSVPGIMSARTLESEKDRKLTALLVPLMSCNARLPVYALFASIFFEKNKSLIVFSLYLIGILVAFIMGLFFKNTIFKNEEEPFIIELPQYKLPEPKNLLIHTWDKGKGFLKKAGTIIFAISIVTWFLTKFNFSGMTDINNSFLAYIGKFLAPLFKPLGFGSWKPSVALLTGLMAKEVIVGTLGVIFGGNLSAVLPQYFTPLSAFSFLVFVLLYTPCISTVIVMKKEYGTKLMIFSIIYQILLAWTFSLIVYNVGILLIR